MFSFKLVFVVPNGEKTEEPALHWPFVRTSVSGKREVADLKEFRLDRFINKEYNSAPPVIILEEQFLISCAANSDPPVFSRFEHFILHIVIATLLNNDGPDWRSFQT